MQTYNKAAKNAKAAGSSAQDQASQTYDQAAHHAGKAYDAAGMAFAASCCTQLGPLLPTASACEQILPSGLYEADVPELLFCATGLCADRCGFRLTRLLLRLVSLKAQRLVHRPLAQELCTALPSHRSRPLAMLLIAKTPAFCFSPLCR